MDISSTWIWVYVGCVCAWKFSLQPDFFLTGEAELGIGNELLGKDSRCTLVPSDLFRKVAERELMAITGYAGVQGYTRELRFHV